MTTPYLTVEQAQEIADERLNVEAWDDAVDRDGSYWGDPGTECVKAIIMATRAINRLNYLGSKTESDQANAFPRDGDTDVPEAIKLACFEIALALLDGVDPIIEVENQLMVSQGYANVRSTYNQKHHLPHHFAGIPSVEAWQYLAPYLIDSQALVISRVS